MHMQPAQFGAAVQHRKHLAGVEQPIRVEGAFKPLLMGEIGLYEAMRSTRDFTARSFSGSFSKSSNQTFQESM